MHVSSFIIPSKLEVHKQDSGVDVQLPVPVHICNCIPLRVNFGNYNTNKYLYAI